GEYASRSSMASRTSSSQSRSSGAKVTRPAFRAAAAARSWPCWPRSSSTRSGSPRKRLSRREGAVGGGYAPQCHPPERDGARGAAVRRRIRAEVQPVETDRRGRAIVLRAGAVEHVDAVGRQGQLEQRPREARARLDQREDGAGGDVEALEGPAEVEADLPHQPVGSVLDQEPVVGAHPVGVSPGAE